LEGMRGGRGVVAAACARARCDFRCAKRVVRACSHAQASSVGGILLSLTASLPSLVAAAPPAPPLLALTALTRDPRMAAEAPCDDVLHDA